MTNTPENSSQIEEVISQLQAGDSMPAELLEIFNEEAEDHLRTIYEGFGRLKHEPGEETALSNVRRAAHTLKGAAGAVGLQSATRLSHRMEDLLDRLAANRTPVSERQLNLLLATADQLQDLMTGDFDIQAAAKQIVDLYQRYSQEMGEQAQPDISEDKSDSIFDTSSEDVDFQGEPTAEQPEEFLTSVVSATKTQQVASRLRETAGESTPYLRVPLGRLDNLVSLLGEMIVNRSEFQQRLNEFESRIEDMQSAMERLRNVAGFVENQFDKTNHAISKRGPLPSDFLTAAKTDQFDPLEFEQYEDFGLLEQTLAEADKDAEIMSGEFRSVRSAFDLLLRRQQRLNRDVQNGLMRIRMVPLSSIKCRLERTVRSVSKKLGRQVSFVIDGESIELDKTVLDAITDPILHLIRNALDHGIEDAEVRTAAGKPATATLRLEAVNQGTKILLRVSDDGAGINLDKVRNKAVQQGFIQPDQELTRDELHSLIFLQGFSTANQLTDVSGRGVGMDVVGDAISRLQGTIRVNSETGAGTTFSIELPTTLGVTRAMLVETQGRAFAIPMQSIQKIGRLKPDLVSESKGCQITPHEDRNIRVFDLGTHLQLRNINLETERFVVPMLILGRPHEEVAVTVDSILSCQDIVVKSLGEHLRNVPGINGATVGGDGVVIPILDSSTLIRTDSVPPSAILRRSEYSSPVVRKDLAMVIDDSISVRRVTENALQFAGWNTVSAKDGVDALEQLAQLDTPPDVFLCDMEMPRMDGLELIRQIREQREFELTPIIMVTSRASEKHRHKAFEAGATEYVVKPYNDEQLLELMAQLVLASRETISI